MTHDALSGPFARYVRLYTLHAVEQSSDLLLLRVRIATLRYSLVPLAQLPLDASYAEAPQKGAALVREAVLPRLHALLDARQPFETLELEEGGRLWQRYAAQRGLPSAPVRVPAVQPPRRISPPSQRTAARLAQLERALGVVQTAAETAATLASLWQNWQIARGRRDLLDLQRLLLQNAIHAQLAGQSAALDHAHDPEFVRGYLAQNAGDAAYDAIFDLPPSD